MSVNTFFCPRFGIRCNAVVPGFIKSPMTDAVPEKVLQKIIPFMAMGRMGKPEGELLHISVGKIGERPYLTRMKD